MLRGYYEKSVVSRALLLDGPSTCPTLDWVEIGLPSPQKQLVMTLLLDASPLLLILVRRETCGDKAPAKMFCIGPCIGPCSS